MSSTPADRPRRSGLLSNLSSALAPPAVVDDDPDKPLVKPTGVKLASILVALAGGIFLFLGVLTLSSLDEGLKIAVTDYETAIAKCNSAPPEGAGGFGTAVPALAADATEDVKKLNEACKQYTDVTPTQAMKDNFMSQNTTRAWIVIIFGLLSVAVGWFLWQAAGWARRAAVGLLVLTMLLSMFLQISNLLTMGATLLLVVGVLLTYLGKGGGFFQLVALRRKAA